MAGSSLRVLIVSCVFPPEPVVSSRTSADIARELAARGHNVSILAPFPNRPGARVHQGYSRSLFKRTENGPGPRVLRCFSTLSSSGGIASRFFENVSFGVTSGVAALFGRRPDVIYSNTWPIVASGVVALVGRLRRVPVVMSVQDLYPESLVAQRRVGPDAWVTRILRRVDGAIARSCRALIVISEKFAVAYRGSRGVAEARIHVVPNWGDATACARAEGAAAFREERGMPPGAFVAAYSGNVGTAAAVETLVEAMAHAKDADACYLLVAGEGSALDRCRALASKLNLGRVVFHSPYKVEDTGKVLGAADVLLLPTRGEQSLASTPSKLVDYMLSGRPVLASAVPESDLARTIEQSGCGWVVPPGSPDLLGAMLCELALGDRARLVERGRLARAYALRHLTREVCLPKVIAVIEATAETPG